MFERETEELEFKKTIYELKEGIISLSSMLNKHGHGIVYFGVKNDGSIFGLIIGKNTTSDISREIKEHIRPIIIPTINVIEIEGKKIIKVEAFGDDKPYSAYGRYYIRSNDEDIIMTNKELENYFINKNIDYSKWENEITSYNEDVIDEELLINYINKGNDVGRISFLFKDTKSTLIKLGLMKNGYLNNAGLYLFSNLKPWTVKFAIYPTDERITFIDNVIFKGNIFECIEETYKYILRSINWKAEIIGLERVETPEVPTQAIREIVVNSFAHMRVNNSSFNEIYITPTRIHIYNPGYLVNDISPYDFATGLNGPIARNPLINTILYLNKTIESFGTGFNRVFTLCKKEDIKFNYGNNAFGFYFEFLRNRNRNLYFREPVNRLMNISIVEHMVYDIIKNNDRITKASIAKMIDKSEMTVQRAIKTLIDKEYIIRVGSNKTGYWMVNNSKK